MAAMDNYYLYKDDPVIKYINNKISSICRQLYRWKFSPAAMYRAQLRILDSIIEIEVTVRHWKALISKREVKCQKIVAGFKRKSRNPTEIEKQKLSDLQAQVDSIDEGIKLLLYSRWLLRYVGDGIAWRLYAYDRSKIRVLSDHPPISFLSGKKGLNAEIRKFNKIRNQGKEWVPLLNDLTNCLRHGDISIFKRGEFIGIDEVKSKIRKGRPSNLQKRRQKQRLEGVMRFFSTRDFKDINAASTVIHLKADVLERHNFDSISHAIKDARQFGYGLVEPEFGLVYMVWRLADRSEDEMMIAAQEQFPHLFSSTVTFRSISPRYEQYESSLPITAMDLPPEDIVDLTLGNLGLVAVVNLDCLVKFFRDRGVPLYVVSEERGYRLMMETEPYPSEMLEGLWQRVLLEGLSLRSLCDLVKSILNDRTLYPERSA
jgi:hypothetical protein